jgi:hypothetical protein
MLLYAPTTQKVFTLYGSDLRGLYCGMQHFLFIYFEFFLLGYFHTGGKPPPTPLEAVGMQH